jgi:hypothetical protein
MLALKYMLLAVAIGLWVIAAALIAYDVYFSIVRRRGVATEGAVEPALIRWGRAVQIAALALIPLLISQSIVVVPSGMAAVRVSQISGTRPGAL